MNSFTFKGISSDTFGIIVQELPPIVRPKMRVATITIDGRDGEQITELGYEAYDKSVFIGLKTSEHISAIHAWLTGSGDLVFSNEPTSVYKAAVIDNFELRRLGRFKTSTITFRVQPFKYQAGEVLTESLTIENVGNSRSYPLMTITGTGSVHLLINGIETCILTIDGFVTLDGEKQEAYKGGVLKNRQMTGRFPEFLPGQNIVSTMGTVSKIETLPRSRFI